MGTRSRTAGKRKSNTRNQSTSTSDPVIEDDHEQVVCVLLMELELVFQRAEGAAMFKALIARNILDVILFGVASKFLVAL